MAERSPAAVPLATCLAAPLPRLAVDGDRRLVVPAVAATQGLVGMHRGDRSLVPSVRVVPGDAGTSGRRFQCPLRGVTRQATISLIHQVVDDSVRWRSLAPGGRRGRGWVSTAGRGVVREQSFRAGWPSRTPATSSTSSRPDDHRRPTAGDIGADRWGTGSGHFPELADIGRWREFPPWRGRRKSNHAGATTDDGANQQRTRCRTEGDTCATDFARDRRAGHPAGTGRGEPARSLLAARNLRRGRSRRCGRAHRVDRRLHRVFCVRERRSAAAAYGEGPSPGRWPTISGPARAGRSPRSSSTRVAAAASHGTREPRPPPSGITPARLRGGERRGPC